MQQLDIFDDGHDVMLANDVAGALLRGDAGAAQVAAQRLAAAFSASALLEPAAALIDALAAEAAAADSQLPDAPTALTAYRSLAGPLHAAALQVLGREAAPLWLAERWRALAQRARALPFVAGSEMHAAAFWQQARAWPEAQAAVAGIGSWRRRPLPLLWMARATWHAQGQDAAWPLLAEAAWLVPQHLAGLLADVGQQKAARRFENSFEAADDSTDTAIDWRWFPAWLLVDQPLLAAPLGAAHTAGATPPERGFQLLGSLLRVERLGAHHERTRLRAELKALHAALFAAYMKTRA